MLKLYGHGFRNAANVLKLRAALAEVGAAYSYQAVGLVKGEQRRPAFLALNPHGKVPVLVDDDFILPESDAILWYIAEKFPAAGLVPPDLRGRARVRQWCDFASTSLYAQSYDLHTHTADAQPGDRSPFVATRARIALDRALAVLEKHLEGRQYVAGSTLSIADLSIASVMHMIQTRAQVDLNAYPNIAEHYARISERPAWRKAISDKP